MLSISLAQYWTAEGTLFVMYAVYIAANCELAALSEPTPRARHTAKERSPCKRTSGSRSEMEAQAPEPSSSSAKDREWPAAVGMEPISSAWRRARASATASSRSSELPLDEPPSSAPPPPPRGVGGRGGCPRPALAPAGTVAAGAPGAVCAAPLVELPSLAERRRAEMEREGVGARRGACV